MTEFNIDDVTRILSRTPNIIRTLVESLPEDWLFRNEGPDTWSPFDVLGHLIHGEEMDWIPRARIILEHGASRKFDPFDRNAQFVKSQGKTVAELLDTFSELRHANILTLQSMKLFAPDYDKEGMHPALGVVTMRQLLATWVVHDMDHISQISRIVGKQYADETGPWKAYLRILQK